MLYKKCKYDNDYYTVYKHFAVSIITNNNKTLQK